MALPTYEKDENALKPNEKKLPLFVSLASWALVALSLFFMYKFTNNRTNSGQIAFGFYMFDSIVWFLIGLYFYFMFVRFTFNQNTMELKIISIFAGIACVAKLVLTILNDLIPNIGNIWSDIYTLGEIAVWTLLSIYFFLYWRRLHDFDFENYGFEDDDDEE